MELSTANLRLEASLPKDQGQRFYTLNALLSKKDERTLVPLQKRHVVEPEPTHSHHDFQSVYGAKLKAKIQRNRAKSISQLMLIQNKPSPLIDYSTPSRFVLPALNERPIAKGAYGCLGEAHKDLFCKLLKKQHISVPDILDISFQDELVSKTESTHKGIKIRFIGYPKDRRQERSPLQTALEVRAVGQTSHLQQGYLD